MKGSLILEKVHDPKLRKEWRSYLDELRAALKNLDRIAALKHPAASKMQYLEAVLQFAEARDKERNFFWDTFVEERIQSGRPDGVPG